MRHAGNSQFSRRCIKKRSRTISCKVFYLTPILCTVSLNLVGTFHSSSPYTDEPLLKSWEAPQGCWLWDGETHCHSQHRTRTLTGKLQPNVDQSVIYSTPTPANASGRLLGKEPPVFISDVPVALGWGWHLYEAWLFQPCTCNSSAAPKNWGQ